MKNIIIDLKSNEEPIVAKSILDELKEIFNIDNTLFINFILNKLNINFESNDPDYYDPNIKDQLLELNIGHILEELIIFKLQNISSGLKNNFKFKDNKYYDFLYKNNKIKLVIFKENSEYSTTTLTASQYENKKNMIFISIVYSINVVINDTDNSKNNSLTIQNIFVNKGKDIKINNDKVLYNSVISIIEPAEENIEYPTALTLGFISNILGDVRIMNINNEENTNETN